MNVDTTELREMFEVQNEIQILFPHVFESALVEEGITIPQAITLKTIKQEGPTCRMSDLAAVRFLTPAAMTGVVDRLIHLGLVERKFDEKDRRVILLSLTRRGEAATSTIEKKIEAIMLRFFESVPKADRAASLRVFKKLAQYLKEQLNAPKKK
jgi:DNA-binding MarR family transcriptional regulator